MNKYLVYEVWTRSRMVEAESEEQAYEQSAPEPCEGMNLSNWHVMPADAPVTPRPVAPLRLHYAGRTTGE